MAFHGFTQGSVHQVQAGKPSKGYDWDIKPSEYNKDRMKPLPAYKMPEVKGSVRNKILNDKPYTEYPGEVAADTPGQDWERLPQQYETYRLKGKTNDPAFKLDPFKAPTVYNQVTNFKEHFAIQDRLHPFRTALDDLPQIFAKAKKTEDERKAIEADFAQRRAMVPEPPIVGPIDPNNPILAAVRARAERVEPILNDMEDIRQNPIGFDDEDLQNEEEYMKVSNLLDSENENNRFSNRDLLMARDRLKNVATVRGPRPARPEDPLHQSMREAREIRRQMDRRRTAGTPGIIDHDVPQWAKEKYRLDHSKDNIEHYNTSAPIPDYIGRSRMMPGMPSRLPPRPQVHNTENEHKHSDQAVTPNDAHVVITDDDIIQEIRGFEDMKRLARDQPAPPNTPEEVSGEEYGDMPSLEDPMFEAEEDEVVKPDPSILDNVITEFKQNNMYSIADINNKFGIESDFFYSVIHKNIKTKLGLDPSERVTYKRYVEYITRGYADAYFDAREFLPKKGVRTRSGRGRNNNKSVSGRGRTVPTTQSYFYLS